MEVRLTDQAEQDRLLAGLVRGSIVWNGHQYVLPRHGKGGLRKIAGAPEPCAMAEHRPPLHMVYEPGTYEYTCPSCGKRTVFRVPRVTC